MSRGFLRPIFILTFVALAMLSTVLLEDTKASPGELPEIVTSVSFDMEEKVMNGSSTITLRGEGEAIFRTGPLKILSLKIGGKSVEPVVKEGELRLKRGKEDLIEIEYQCFSGQGDSCVIDDRGILLKGDWYPSPRGLLYHKLRALVPKGLTAVSEAETIETEERSEGTLHTFLFPHPVDRSSLAAGKFAVTKETFSGIDLYTYFFPEDVGLDVDFTEHAKKYLELYEGMIGTFPYKRFSIVESFLPTGHSMATFTLLGQDVVRQPFIAKTSLGREILRQWLGNCVYIDYESGNWAEGLTSYLSDHLYEEREDRGWEYRKQMLVDYGGYAGGDRDFALKDFREGTDYSSRTIGHGKSAMVFHMLRRLTGDEVFFSSLKSFVESRRFERASWDDIEEVFETLSGKELDWFFAQWVREKGLPAFEVKNAVIHPKGLRSVVSFDIEQAESEFDFCLPVTIRTNRGETRQTLEVNEKKKTFEIIVEGKPERLVIDEDYDVLRPLGEEETPAVIGKILDAEKGMVVLYGGETEDSRYKGAVSFFKKRGFAVKEPSEVKDKDLRESSVVVLDAANPLLKRLFGGVEKPAPGLSITAKRNPMNPSEAVVLLHADSKDEIDASLEKILYCGKYSGVVFSEGRNVVKKIDESESGMVVALSEPVLGIEVTKAMPIEEIVGRISEKQIVYVGEQHDRYEQHLTQLDVIRTLFERTGKIMIGMEMFQRPFQKALDDYIGGKIEERAFLKSSEYFKRWGFDYHLYKDILRFARDEKIPVIALNLRKEIIAKVSKQGLDSLTPEEKKELPESMDMSDEKYRERLREVFEKHDGSGKKSFENFYQSQILWDETMAQSIDEARGKNPGYRMVALVGAGHLLYSSGIPKRTHRRNGADYAVLVQDSPVESEIADFVLFPKPATATSAPKLMVVLKEEEGRTKIVGFAPHSVSESAGLRKDDVILSLDDARVKEMDDVQIFLFFKKKGDTVKVRVLRKRFLFGEKESEIEVTL